MTAKKRLNSPDLAAILGVDRKVVDRYAREGCPCTIGPKGREFDVEAVRAWMASKGRTGRAGRPAENGSAVPGGADGGSDSLNTKLTKAKIAKERALARKHIHQLDTLLGKFISREDVERDMLAKIRHAIAIFNQGPALIAARAANQPAHVVEAVARDVFTAARAALAAGRDTLEEVKAA